MSFRILILLLLPINLFSQTIVRHMKDEQYRKQRKSVAQQLNSCTDWKEQIKCIDSFLTLKAISSPRLEAELENKKAEMMFENAVATLDSLPTLNADFSNKPKYKDSLLQEILNPIQEAWKRAETIYPSPEYGIKNYEKIMCRYYEGSEDEKKVCEMLMSKGYRKKFSSVMISAGARGSDKNLWFYAEESFIRNEIQPGYRIKTEKVNIRYTGKFTETCILSAEIKNSDNYAFTFSPARVTSLFYADPIRVGLKTSSEGKGFAWFLRPSLGISYRFFSLGYSVNIYFRKSEGLANDLHYLNFRASVPIFKTN